MPKFTILALMLLLIVSIFAFNQIAKAEEIHFNNDVFTLKQSSMSAINKGYENEYFLKNENIDNWTKLVGIYYYPEVSNPIKFADNECKSIEGNDINVLLKYIENKKADKAALSYLQNGSVNGRNFFEYNIFKYEEHPEKGMMALRYAIRYFFNNNNEITTLAQKVKAENDEYLTKIIESPIPPIVEKDISEK